LHLGEGRVVATPGSNTPGYPQGTPTFLKSPSPHARRCDGLLRVHRYWVRT
jgi:hypothetical protein